jgi:O-antigen ligase
MSQFLDKKSVTGTTWQYLGLWEALLLFFTVGIMTLSQIEGLSGIMVVYGLILSGSFLLYFLYFKLKVPPEVIIYFVWIAWSVVGLFSTINLELFIVQFLTIVQMGVMIFIVASITALRLDMSISMIGIALGGGIVAASIFFTGEYQQLSAFQSNTQAMGLTTNANALAYHALFVMIAVFYFWRKKGSLFLIPFQYAFIGTSILAVIYSASRKGIIGVLVFILLWFWFCHGKMLIKKPLITFLIFVVISISVYFTAEYILSSTYLGRRFKVQEVERGSESRLQMYKDGMTMLKSSPIWGIGLNNYKLLSMSRTYSHSDYVEVLANTGIVGFILYFSIYAILWRRLNHIQRMTTNEHLLYINGFLKAAILTILLLAVGRPNITSKLTWVFLAGAIGYSWSIVQEIRD